MNQFSMFRPPGGARGAPKPKKAEKKNTDIFGDGPLPRSPGLHPPADGEREGGLGLADTQKMDFSSLMEANGGEMLHIQNQPPQKI
jgi:hypothetical protein